MPDELVYHQQTVSILDPVPRVSPEALAALDERERSLGIRIPAAVREWYSLERAVELLATYSNDDHPVRLEELGEPDWDWHAFQEHLKSRVAESDWDASEPEWQGDALAGDPLVIMYENQAVCRWAVPLGQADDPAVLVQNDAMLGWRKVSDRFSSFVYSYVWNYCLVQYAACVLIAESKPITAANLAFVREHFLEAPTTREWPLYDTPHRYDHYRFVSHDGQSRILIEDILSDRSVWHLASDTLLALGQTALTLRDQGAFVNGPDVRMRCQPGLNASWDLGHETSPRKPETLGQLIARLGDQGEMGLWLGRFNAHGDVILDNIDRRRFRFYACMPNDDPDSPRPPKLPRQIDIPDGSAVMLLTSYSRQRGNATDG